MTGNTWLNTAEAAQYLDCCERTFESWAVTSGLRKHKIGRLVRWNRTEIDKALMAAGEAA